MPFVRIFGVPLVFDTLICVRDLSVNRYGLEHGDLRCWMTVRTAYLLGYAATRLKQRQEGVESGRREAMKPGPVFRSWLPTVDGTTKVLFEIGVSDNGAAIYFGADDQCAELGVREGGLLQALYWLADDVASLNEFVAPRAFQGDVVPGLRDPELALPAWAIDELWTKDGRRK
jgi:hypothetical protein